MLHLLPRAAALLLLAALVGCATRDGGARTPLAGDSPAPDELERRFAAADRPQWIWLAGREEEVGRVLLRRDFELEAAPAQATATITADNGYKLAVNGRPVGADSGYAESLWSRAERYDVATLLRAGRNVLAVEAENLGGPAGLLLELEIPRDGGEPLRIPSDRRFLAAPAGGRPEPEGWATPDFAPAAE